MFFGRIKQKLLAALAGDVATVIDGRKEMGLVSWDMLPPAGIPYTSHKFSIFDALETASWFLGTDYSVEREWVVIGGAARVVLMTLPQFISGANSDGLFNGPKWKGHTYLGSVGPRKYYYRSGSAFDELMVMFNHSRAVRIQLLNAPVR